MWDKLFEIVSVGVGVVVVCITAYWAIKQWKLQYRDELREWLSNHPNSKFKTIGLKVVYGVDSTVVLVNRIVVAIFGRSAAGQETTITTKTLTIEEAEKMGLIKDKTIQNNDINLFDESEILNMMSS